ncbi:MAG: hypothetical protein B7Z80_04015 [Rhodospirillales bacterium 20-64-7]|nr:MAG: hypothetical protein B7Z80_04015 [Rhodospirillales bacterium 20-64-7]
MDVYFDESGQTGTHLLDASQPLFTLGSTNVPEAEAAAIIARCFPRQQGDELKSRNLLRRPQGRQGYLEFAREVARTPERFIAAKIDKRFTVVSKMVDNLIEPLFSARGYDFYANDWAKRFANSASFVFDNILDRAAADGLMGLYNDFARRPNAVTFAPLRSALEAALKHAPTGAEITLGLMAKGAELFNELQGYGAIEDSNDVHVTGVVQCMAHWQGLSPGPFKVVHDESKHFFKRSRRWEMITNPAAAAQVFAIGDRTLTLPILVKETVGARSQENASLQLCDLVAGFVARGSASGKSDEDREFISQAITVGMGELKIFPVAAGSEFTEGPPERATGPDVVDRIMRAVAPMN